MALNKRNEGAKINSNINVTPMLQHGMQVDQLARTNNPREMPDADKEDAVLIAVMRDGKVFLGTDQIQPDQLTQKVKDRVASRTDKTVFIKSDARAKYGNVVEVVDNVRSAGVDQVGLLTEQKKTPGQPKAAGGGTTNQ